MFFQLIFQKANFACLNVFYGLTVTLLPSHLTNNGNLGHSHRYYLFDMYYNKFFVLLCLIYTEAVQSINDITESKKRIYYHNEINLCRQYLNLGITFSIYTSVIRTVNRVPGRIFLKLY